jgi:hypothetical protein
MQKFLSSLDYRKIFHQFENTPSSSILAKNELYAQSNLDFASNYICAKICSVAIVEAIALETGGDCPISLFLGDIRCYEGTPDRIEKFLPNNIQDNNSLNTNLLDVLAGGRSKESRNDLTSSPLTAYFYRIVGHEEMLNIFKLAEKMFSDEITPHQFLRSLDRFLVQSIIQGCKKIAISRTNHLDDLAKTLH